MITKQVTIDIQPAKCWYCLRTVDASKSINIFEIMTTFCIWGNKPWTKDVRFQGQLHPTKDGSNGHKVGFALFHKYCFADWMFEEQNKPL